MGYLKDVVLPRVLDDATFATLSSLMLFNNIEVLMALHQDQDFFPELFRWGGQALPHGALQPRCTSTGSPRQMQSNPLSCPFPLACSQLKQAEPDGQEWRDLVAFLQVRSTGWRNAAALAGCALWHTHIMIVWV